MVTFGALPRRMRRMQKRSGRVHAVRALAYDQTPLHPELLPLWVSLRAAVPVLAGRQELLTYTLLAEFGCAHHKDIPLFLGRGGIDTGLHIPKACSSLSILLKPSKSGSVEVPPRASLHFAAVSVPDRHLKGSLFVSRRGQPDGKNEVNDAWQFMQKKVLFELCGYVPKCPPPLPLGFL